MIDYFSLLQFLPVTSAVLSHSCCRNVCPLLSYYLGSIRYAACVNQADCSLSSPVRCYNAPSLLFPSLRGSWGSRPCCCRLHLLPSVTVVLFLVPHPSAYLCFPIAVSYNSPHLHLSYTGLTDGFLAIEMSLFPRYLRPSLNLSCFWKSRAEQRAVNPSVREIVQPLTHWNHGVMLLLLSFALPNSIQLH